jgi:hypothetical protein
VDEEFTIVVGFTQKATDGFSKGSSVFGSSMLGGDIQGVSTPKGGRASHVRQVCARWLPATMFRLSNVKT